MWSFQSRAKIIMSCLVVLLGNAIGACSTIPEPIEENVTYPYTFSDVRYLAEYGGLLFAPEANLTVDLSRLIYTNGKDVNVEILLEDIEEISYKKFFVTDPNNYVVISYRSGTLSRKALFTAFRYGGWVGGSSEIYRVILHAHTQHKARGVGFLTSAY